ncbi:MAG: hypothetical protein AB7F95_11805 [Burkholderiales bacterium]
MAARIPSFDTVYFLRLAGILAGMLMALPLQAREAPAEARIELSVLEADWGAADAGEVQAVLSGVAAELLALFPDHPALRVQVAPTAESPMVLFRRGSDGSHRVLLRARDREWADYVYEFAHELGHILTNYGRHAHDPGLARYQWFEEALCDMVALHALRRIAERAQAGALGPQLAAHAGAMREFADQLLKAPHRASLHGADLSAWLRLHEPALRTDPYHRARNEEVAAHLLRIFERDPSGFSALAFVNASRAPAPRSFADYLAEWCDHTPASAQPVVREIIAAFGFQAR